MPFLSFLPRGLSDSNFIRLSVTRVLSDGTKENTADILTKHEIAITLVNWCQQKSMGDVSFYLKFTLKVTPFFENADFDQYLLITSQP